MNPRDSGDYPTYAAGDQLNQTHGGAQAHFHTLIHLCAFTNSIQDVVIKCMIILWMYFKVTCDTMARTTMSETRNKGFTKQLIKRLYYSLHRGLLSQCTKVYLALEQ